MKKLFLLLIPLVIIIVVAGIRFSPPREIIVASHSLANPATASSVVVPQVPEAAPLTSNSSTPSSLPLRANSSNSLGTFTSQLPNPPTVMRGLYITRYVAGIPSWTDKIIATIKAKNLNAVVIDVKDYSGYVTYKTGVPDVVASGAESETQVKDIGALLKKFHDNNIYTIARVTVFQDPVLAKFHPEWAVQNKNTGKPWTDNHGLRWMDAAGEGTWKYVASIGHDALKRGFDEINFDYIRFPSDGDLSAMSYPFWNASTTPKHVVLQQFFKFLRNDFAGEKISADVFGLTTVNSDDMGIGQVITDAYKYFDYVSPMIYPSHFATGFIGYKNPADHPYEVISYSLEKGLNKLTTNSTVQIAASKNTTSSAPLTINNVLSTKLRPWLQEFDLGAVYTHDMIDEQIKATEDVLNTATSSASYGGYLLWDPSNKYARL